MTIVDSMLSAPVGVALLASLEAGQRSPAITMLDVPRDCDPSAVQRAAAAAGEMSFGRYCAVTIDAAGWIAGPWTADAASMLVRAYRDAPKRRPIAEAVAARYGALLHADLDADAQQWWLSTAASAESPRALFGNFERVYGRGEFTFDGLWTVTDPPLGVHDELIAAWEMGPGPISRWRVPVPAAARIWEVHEPADWARLVEAYPKVTTGMHMGWELPGPNQPIDSVSELVVASAGRAARTVEARYVVPDWRSVAADYDGVHVSWAGFMTSEGFVSDVAGGAVTMLRYWGSERTLWLTDAFGDPEPLDAPTLSGAVNGIVGVGVRTDPGRRDLDMAVMRTRLAR